MNRIIKAKEITTFESGSKFIIIFIPEYPRFLGDCVAVVGNVPTQLNIYKKKQEDALSYVPFEVGSSISGSNFSISGGSVA